MVDDMGGGMKRCKLIHACALSLAAVLSAGDAFAQSGQWLGADKVLQTLREAGKKDAKATGGGGAGEAARYASLLRDFSQRSTNMTPAAAAGEWLKLFDGFWNLPLNSVSSRFDLYGEGESPLEEEEGSDPVSIRNVMMCLPPPEAWPALAAQMERREVKKGNAQREWMLRIFVAALNADSDSFSRSMRGWQDSLGSLPEGMRYSMQSSGARLAEIGRLLSLGTNTSPEQVALEFGRAVEAIKEKSSRYGDTSLEVPDLVALAGEEKARSILTAALMLPRAELRFSSSGPATLRLAREIVLQRIKDIPRPQWGLACTPDAMALYEAMEARFPEKSAKADAAVALPFGLQESLGYLHEERSWERQAARRSYLMGLLSTNRIEEAVRVATRMEENELRAALQGRYEFQRVEVPDGTWEQFFNCLLEQKTTLGVIDCYIPLAQRTGKLEGVIRKLEAAGRKPDRAPADRRKIESALMRAHLAANNVDAALQLLKRAAAEPAVPQGAGRGYAGDYSEMNELHTLLRIGLLIDRKDCVETALNAYGSRPAAGGGAYFALGAFNTQTLDLLPSNYWPQVESICLNASLPPADSRPEEWAGSVQYDQVLRALLQLYVKAGRCADARTLLDKAPWWNVPDLGDLGEPELSTAAAQVLIATGDKDRALRALQNAILMNPGEDGAYEVLTAHWGLEVVPWLDAVYARDRFEERPLIWKARLLHLAGMNEEAEKVIREALKVDPTDGETRAGDRVRAYSVMAEIAAARGRAEDAKFFNNVVKSVRIAERGDQFNEIGLTVQSLQCYAESEALFADAYCIQWRLAERLYALGRKEEAEKHYAIAFERMPEQFGQVASLCFGCEGVFNEPQSRSVADRILTRLSQSTPARPQVFFLLGQLRQAQERLPEAYAAYRKALELDPDYLDVWTRILELAQGMYLPQGEVNKIMLRILELRPKAGAAGYGRLALTDMKGLWAAAAKAKAPELKWQAKVFALPASAALLETQSSGMGGGRFYSRSTRWDRAPWRTPAEALLSQPAIGELLALMMMERQMSASEADLNVSIE